MSHRQATSGALQRYRERVLISGNRYMRRALVLSTEQKPFDYHAGAAKM